MWSRTHDFKLHPQVTQTLGKCANLLLAAERASASGTGVLCSPKRASTGQSSKRPHRGGVEVHGASRNRPSHRGLLPCAVGSPGQAWFTRTASVEPNVPAAEMPAAEASVFVTLFSRAPGGKGTDLFPDPRLICDTHVCHWLPKCNLALARRKIAHQMGLQRQRR